MGCKPSRDQGLVDDAEFEERIRTAVTEQAQSSTEATAQLRKELSTLKEGIQALQGQSEQAREEKTALLEMMKKGQDLDTKEIKLELGERQVSNQRLRQDIDELKTKSASESAESLATLEERIRAAVTEQAHSGMEAMKQQHQVGIPPATRML
jgi:hypothetical protein